MYRQVDDFLHEWSAQATLQVLPSKTDDKLEQSEVRTLLTRVGRVAFKCKSKKWQ
ncbi:hypothetical protein PVA17_13690 [Lysinibacillus sp. CNPSo 3705]|uniref:hypothetical protein n=1 Tax=Lysinibacillus sp. CNPSo 3705 TaxID=3028148 RepID=UPI0023632FEE|nr:hypothetical protein [Lysinibacillus sp. CNPSo 3705]MDD1503810.1 hypothetical protein [Lysinibacillus sp. CNPSo 3705]